MQRHFRFLNKDYALEVTGSAETENEFMRVPASVSYDGTPHHGALKLTSAAWELATRKSREGNRPLEEVLAGAVIAALKAELYIRRIPDGFVYVVDHRFFEDA